jgi:putative N-acetyltransferase (TIGR04045 family)
MLQVERVSVECRAACTPDELAAHHVIRHRVFVDEQRVFTNSDRDGNDGHPLTVRAIGLVEAAIGGTVRLFPLDETAGLWQGDRLAVLPEHRAHGLGAPLVRYAVRSATERGGEIMIAHIQLPNVAFFERLGWHRNGDVENYQGLPHLPMAIDLAAGPSH